MRDAIEELISLHPAYGFDRLAHRRSGLAAGAGRECRDWRGRHEHEIEPGGHTWMIEAAAAAAAFAVFVAVLMAIAGLTIDAPDPGQPELAATADPAVVR
jgi:hypothetical protein